jgi:hypothetical protein
MITKAVIAKSDFCVNMYMMITTLSYIKHEDDMLWRKCERHEYIRKKRKTRVVYPVELRDEDFHIYMVSKGSVASHRERG